MEPHENDYDRIATGIDEALAAFTGNAHEHLSEGSDSLTMTKDGFIKGVIRLQRLRDWVEGLAETCYKSNAVYSDVTFDDILSYVEDENE